MAKLGQNQTGDYEQVKQDLKRVRPEFIVIIGRDTTHERGTHPLHGGERAFFNADEAATAGIVDNNETLSAVPVYVEKLKLGDFRPDYIDSLRAASKALAGAVDGRTYTELLAALGRGESASFMVVADGRQRVIAARAANKPSIDKGTESGLWITVSVMTGDANHKQALHIAALVFNTPLTPAQKARLYSDWKTLHGGEKASRTDAARQFGCTNENIRQMEMFLSLAPELQAKVDDGSLSYFASLKLYNASAEAQREAAAQVGSTEGGQDATDAVEEIAVREGTIIKPPSTKVLGLLAEKLRKEAAQFPQFATVSPAIWIELALGKRTPEKVVRGFAEFFATIGQKPAKEPKAPKEPKAASAATGKAKKATKKK